MHYVLASYFYMENDMIRSIKNKLNKWQASLVRKKKLKFKETEEKLGKLRSCGFVASSQFHPTRGLTPRALVCINMWTYTSCCLYLGRIYFQVCCYEIISLPSCLSRVPHTLASPFRPTNRSPRCVCVCACANVHARVCVCVSVSVLMCVQTPHCSSSQPITGFRDDVKVRGCSTSVMSRKQMNAVIPAFLSKR